VKGDPEKSDEKQKGSEVVPRRPDSRAAIAAWRIAGLVALFPPAGRRYN
jgi:hypothetical protein